MLNNTKGDWPLKPLSEVVDFNPRLDKSAYPDDLKVSFVPMAAVSAGSGHIEVSQSKHFSKVKKGYTPFQEDDVLFAKITPCMENGKMAVVPKLSNGLGFGSTEFHVLRPHEGIDSRYIYYFVSSQRFRREAAHRMTGAVGQKRVPLRFLEETLIPVPAFDDQKHIVAEIEKQFSRLDEAVANLKRIKANLKRYKAAVLKAAVEGKLTEDWRKAHPNVEPATTLLNRILTERRTKWKGKGKYKEPVAPPNPDSLSLPKSWTWVTVGDLITEALCNGISVKGSNNPPGIRALRLSAMSNSGFDYSDVRYLPLVEDKVDDLWIQRGDFFISRGNGSLHLVGRGTSAKAPPEATIFPDTMIRLRLAKTIQKTGWVRTIWQSRTIRSQIEKRVKTTAGIYKISQPEVCQITLPFPPIAEQNYIVAEVERRLSVINELETTVEANLTRANRLRQAVLRAVFSGALSKP